MIFHTVTSKPIFLCAAIFGTALCTANKIGIIENIVRTIALYTRAVNVVKKKYILCGFGFAAHGKSKHTICKKEKAANHFAARALFKCFFVFHNKVSDINIITRGDTADESAQNNINNKENDICCALLFIILIYSGRHIGKGFAVFDALNSRVNIPATNNNRRVISK